MNAALQQHLASGVTHLCQCWSVARKDGVVLGFTDHDAPLSFDGITYSPRSGLSGRALSSSTGLSVDNSEALGVLSDDAITETDIAAGRYDGATVTVLQVQWDAPSARRIMFRGTIGEITRGNGQFEAELLGPTAPLNQPVSRFYLKDCTTVLGSARCKVDLGDAQFSADSNVLPASEGDVVAIANTPHRDGWFTGGMVEVTGGAATGLRAEIKRDQVTVTGRSLTLWRNTLIGLQAGDGIRVIAGCDKRAATCRAKFDNFLNFQGFPDMPTEDWLMEVPRRSSRNNGGSMNR